MTDMLADLAATPAWLPFERDPARGQVTLLHLSESDYRAASFLDQRVLRPDSALIEAEWATLALPGGARRDAQYIFHIGNVGSTLISRLLGELDGVFALREPLLLRSFAESPPDAGDFDRLTALLSRTFQPGQRANVKATSFTSEIADRLVPPGSKALFLFARPDRYLENILAGENSWQTLQALSPIRLARLRSRCPELEADVSTMHDGLKAALGWACEMTSLEAAAGRMPADTIFWLDFDTFLSDPSAHLAAIAAHFGHEADAATIDAIVQGPLMTRYSKALDYEYSPDLRRRILADARHRHGAAIRDGLNWLAGLAGRYPAVADAIRRARGTG
jgi:hypothetical protein